MIYPFFFPFLFGIRIFYGFSKKQNNIIRLHAMIVFSHFVPSDEKHPILMKFVRTKPAEQQEERVYHPVYAS
uniref:Uncharacterized protein n=1 Tax=Anguilla anguilla TaxID=7936 RepID=A0A0E9X0M4_ANGAN